MPLGASSLAQGSEHRAQRSNLHRREQDSGTYRWVIESEVWHMGQAGARALKHGTVREAKSFTVATAKDVNPPSPN